MLKKKDVNGNIQEQYTLKQIEYFKIQNTVLKKLLKELENKNELITKKKNKLLTYF